jgi:RNA polymerase sigma-70 factor (ECF subfamily)
MQITIDTATFNDVQPVLLGYAQRAVRREDLARDLVQETWAAGTRHLGSFDGRSTFRSWMVGILKHKIIDHFRRSGREVPLDDRPEPSAEPRMDAGLDHRRAIELLRAELGTLPELQRRAVELCDVRGLGRDAAAAELGVERGHLRVLLHRGRHRLRRALEERDVSL